jgi:hypothetical protein
LRLAGPRGPHTCHSSVVDRDLHPVFGLRIKWILVLFEGLFSRTAQRNCLRGAGGVVQDSYRGRRLRTLRRRGKFHLQLAFFLRQQLLRAVRGTRGEPEYHRTGHRNRKCVRAKGDRRSALGRVAELKRYDFRVTDFHFFEISVRRLDRQSVGNRGRRRSGRRRYGWSGGRRRRASG